MPEFVKRYAIVRNARRVEEVEAFLPANYEVVFADDACTFDRKYVDGSVPENAPPHLAVVIEGRDSAGWTYDAYVKPRLETGLLYAEEIDLSHPIMRRISA